MDFFKSDNPVVDAGMAAIDMRPIVSECDHCHHAIRGAHGIYGGDRFYDIPELATIHEECLTDWADDYEQEGSDNEAICVVCGEDQREYLHYKIRDEVVCWNCLTQWAKEYALEVNDW